MMVNFKEVKNMLKIGDELETLAMACYTLNQDYCDAITLDYEYTFWADLDRDVQLSYIAAVYTLFNKLELMYPQDRTNVDKLAKEQHDAWLESRKAEGWSFGLSVNKELKTHPNMVEWEELSHEEKLKDILFVTTVLAHFNRIKKIGSERLMTNEERKRLESLDE